MACSDSEDERVDIPRVTLKAHGQIGDKCCTLFIMIVIVNWGGKLCNLININFILIFVL